jgi:glycosyltransferase involved in cell wall biosynthesis
LPAPAVSVVVPARDAAATLPATLAALSAQTFAEPVEVIVVDDRSADATVELARAAGVRVLTTSGAGGPGEARNVGVRAASAPLLAFTDADAAPAPQWLERGVAALRSGADLVQGRVLPDPAVPVGPFDRTLWVRRPSPLFETANLFVTRTAFDRVGGFPRIGSGGEIDRRLRFPMGAKSIGEDTLFGWAIKRSGARVAFAPEALVHHAVFPRRARGYVAERERLRFFPHLVREVPELRAHLFGRVFLSRRTAAFDAALAGCLVAACTQRRLTAAAAVPYVLVARAPWRLFAAGLTADAVGFAALVRGSVASRTPVL